MRFTRKNMPRSRLELDQFVHANGLNPVGEWKHGDKSIFIAETDFENNKPIEYPTGYYQVAWFVFANDKLDVGRGIDFDGLHDMMQGWTIEAKRQARINTALEDARKWLDQSDETGRFDEIH